MSIMIKGMNMPDKCGHCRFATAFDCGVDGQFIKTHDARRKDCPLTEVPGPHGDLIDRDKLRAKEFIHDGDAYAVVMSRDIRNAPTIIPADESDMDSFIRVFEEDDEEDEMDSFIRILKD